MDYITNPCIPIVIEQGATFDWPITYLESDGSVVSLAGYTAKMQIRQTIEATGTVANLTTENGGISIDPAMGLITILISAAVSSTMAAPFEGKYDLLLYSTSGLVEKLLYGPAKVVPVVTR